MGSSVQQTIDGGYIIAGETASFGAGGDDVYLIKTDANGDTLWTKTFGGPNDDFANSVEQTTDGGYIIAAETMSFVAGNPDLYLIRTDANGDTLWTKTYGGANTEAEVGNETVQQTNDGGFILESSTNSFGAGNFDVYLIKTDGNGIVLWTKTFGGSSNDVGGSVQQTTDGGYIIGGGTSSFGASANSVYLIKTNSSGDTLWTQTYGGTNVGVGTAVYQTTDGGYIIGGAMELTSFDSVDFYLIKTDANGNSGCAQSGTSTIITTPATLVASTATTVISPNTILSRSTAMVSSSSNDSTFCTSVGIDEIENDNSFIVYPNPSHSSFTITTSSQLQNGQIEIYNLLGDKIYTSIYGGQKTVSCELFPKGIYFVKLQSEKGSAVQKLLVE